MSRGRRDNDSWISYKEESRIAAFFQSVLSPPPETGEKAFTLIADGKNIRLDFPKKLIDLRGLMVDIPYTKNPGTGITAKLRELLKKAPDHTEWQVNFEKPGYAGSMEIEIREGDCFRAWTGTKFRDKSRFPARIKAAATALLHEGCRGEFQIEAQGESVFIRKK